jgi:DNA-binding beta-propeller fold protein YncE
MSTGAVVGSAVMVGDNPQGVAVIPRLGRAVVTNLDSDNATLVPYFDLTTNMITASGTTVNVTTGNGPLGVAVNPNDAQAVVANSLANTVSLFDAAATSSVVAITSTVETRPTAVTIDPVRNLAAVTHTTSSSVVLVNLPVGSISGRATVPQLPEGVVYDAESDRFVVASSLSNNLTLVNPTAASSFPVKVGINPTSIAYNRHSSTLVTVNSASNTMTVMDFKNLRVREVLSVLGSPRFAVAINEQTNVAAVVDQANNRVLLIQLPR